MDTLCIACRANRRSVELSDGETECGCETTDRREVLRVSHNRIFVRRPTRVLLPPGERLETHTPRIISNTRAVDDIKINYPTTVCQVPHIDLDNTVHVRTGSSESRRSPDVYGMSSLSIRRKVLFDNNVTVFTPTDWTFDEYRYARKGYWMQAAADRYRFERRIKQTELIFGNIFTNAHRSRVFRRYFM